MNHKVLVVGCGNMANVWVEFVQEQSNIEIVGLVDIYESAALRLKNQFQLQCELFTDLETALKSTSPSIVFDITIPQSHYSVSTLALQYGCHVFSEKPLAEQLEQCKEIVALSNKLGRTHAVMQNRRFDPNIRALRNLIDYDIIGKVEMLHADFFIGAHFGGFRDEMEHPLLVDMAIHTFDQARYISQADPVSVYCHEFNTDSSWYKGNASAICIFEMSDGSVYSYRGSWSTEGATTSWEGNWRVNGSKGTIIWDGQSAPYAEVVQTSSETEFIQASERINSTIQSPKYTFHKGCLAHLFQAIENNTVPETVCSDNLLSMAMVFAAVQSAKTNKKVYFSDLLS